MRNFSYIIFLVLFSSCWIVQCRKPILLQGGTVLAFNVATERVSALPDTSVLVIGDRIEAIFNSSENVSIPPDTEIISAAGKIISPGFVDTHRHGWETAYKTLASNTTLAEYFPRYSEYSMAQRVFSAEDVYYGQLAGIYEALNSGVTSILDHAHHTWSNETALAGLNASIDSGARVWWCYAIHHLTNGFSVAEQMANFRAIHEDERWMNTSVSIGLAYDNFGSAVADEVNAVINLAK
jgi:cytosine/adenosine deaminase-related metal-dependent hydrolase